MKNILFILKDDLRKILSNPASLIVVGALCIIPSLYAWFNIWASWDPYGDTEGIKIAVASEDKDVEVEDKKINVGDEVITTLSKNDELGWEFMSKKEVIEKVKKGDYYAGIVIPENFSDHLLSVVRDEEIKKPILGYYINEKVNAISPKVTSKGATTVVDNIEESFIEEVNETVLNVFDDIGVQLDENYDDIEKIRDGILDLEEEMPYLYSEIEKVQDGVDLGQTGVDEVRDSLDNVDNLHGRLTKVNDDLIQRLDDSEADAHDAIGVVTNHLHRAQDTFQEVPRLTDKISGKGKDLDRLSDSLRRKQDDLDTASDRLQDVANTIDEQDDKLKESTKIKDMQDRLSDSKKDLESLNDDIDRVKKELENGHHPAVSVIERLSDCIDRVASNINDLFTDYNEVIRPQLDHTMEELSDVASNIDGFFDSAGNRNKEALDKIQKLQESIDNLDKEKLESTLDGLSKDIEKNLTRVNVIIPVLTVAEKVLNINSDSALSDKVSNLNEKMKDTRTKLNKALVLVDSAKRLAGKDETLSKKVVNNIENSLNDVDKAIHSAQDHWNTKTEDALDNGNEILQKLDDRMTERYDNLKELRSDLDNSVDELYDKAKNPKIAIGALDRAMNGIDKGTNGINTIDDGLESIQNSIDSIDISQEIEGIHAMQDRLEDTNSSIDHIISRLQETKNNGKDVLEGIDREADQIDDSLGDMIDFVDGDLKRKYERIIDDAKTALNSVSTVFDDVDAQLPKVNKFLDKIDNGLTDGKGKIDFIEEEFPVAKDAISQAADKIRDLEKEGNLHELIDFLRNDPQRISEFLAKPVELDEHEMFPVPNYGSAMNPFYTTLSLWVGGLLLVSSLRVDRPDKLEFRSHEVYLARLIIFAMIGIIQGVIVTLGNLFIIGAYVVDKMEYVLFCMLIGMVFITIVYTLVSVFGNVGKVLAVIFLVMQIGGSGGTYPIQMAPEFFQKIHAFLPFTHGIELLRESVAGIIWSVAWTKIIYLMVYFVVFIIIGITFKKFFNRKSDKFAAKAEESGFIL